jgi:tyrosine-protein phosphatase SIW14
MFVRRNFPGLVLCGILLLAASLCAQSSTSPSTPVVPHTYGERLKLPGVHNAGKISDSLYRGAQPHAESLQQLKDLGITTIVDLRGEDRERVTWERKQAESLGIRFVNIPISGWSPPTNEQLAEFLSLFHGSPQQKIFVHCRLGEDRTGVFTAVYRMAIEKWPAKEAMKEMYFFGFNGFWHPAMKSFIRDFPSQLQSAPAFASLRAVGPQP